MILLTDHAEGLLLPVRAQPGARKPGHQNTFQLRLQPCRP